MTDSAPSDLASSDLLLNDLIVTLRSSISILHKRDIQTAASTIGQYVTDVDGAKILLGDDCAAIPNGNEYLLLAAEGIWPQFVARDPWFAGWCAIMVNLSDVAAMGGEAIAVVDALWSQSVEQSKPLWAGMQAAAKAYGVPIVGGHTNCHSEYDGLAVAVLGRSPQLITSFDASPGDALMLVIDMKGAYYGDYMFWNAATKTDSGVLRKQLALLPKLAATGLCSAGKDVSMGGLAGTLLMLCEASNCGALLDLDRMPKPQQTSWSKWLISFPSYGFVLSVPRENVAKIENIFSPYALATTIGEMTTGLDIIFQLNQRQQTFWNLKDSLTGFSATQSSSSTL